MRLSDQLDYEQLEQSEIAKTAKTALLGLNPQGVAAMQGHPLENELPGYQPKRADTELGLAQIGSVGPVAPDASFHNPKLQPSYEKNEEEQNLGEGSLGK